MIRWFLALFCLVAFAVSAIAADRLRLLIETDAGGDPDDEQSLVRFLLYANEWDVEGMIANRPVARGGENRNPERTGLGIVRRQLNAYGDCWTNLARHDPRYPTKDFLWSRTVAGHNDTDQAEKLIISAVDRPDPRPLWYSDWGTDHGAATNNLKRALDRVLRERGPDGYAQFKSKLRLSSYDKFAEHTATIAPPFALWVNTFQPVVDGKRWYHRFSALTSRAGGFDLVRDVLTGHGPLGALYPTNTTHWAKEGDSMTFLYLVPTGLNDPHEPTWGSWAGRYGLNTNFPSQPYYWASLADTWNGTTHRDHTLARWAAALQNDFRARLNWCVAGEFAKANHRPTAVLDGDGTRDVLRRRVKSGDTVRFTSRGSADPDGHAIRTTWFVYREAGTFPGEIRLESLEGESTGFVAPRVEQPASVHVILQVQDNGTPSLSAYRRVVCLVQP
ncbi:MAG: DUF1593 domain-containing protein [Verrucomicrobia bacterium]|nr:DUF1593 domain-containing protein [Verrucomicrobiota bacterium]